MSWKVTLLGLSKALRSGSSAWGGNTGCKCTAWVWMQSQELVILWVTLPPGWDTRPDWGHELVLDLLPGVLFEVCLDGTRLWNLPLQFCAVQNKSHECRGENWRKPTRGSPADFPLSSLPPPPHQGPPPLFPPYPDTSSCPVYLTCSSQALLSQSLVLAQVSAQGTALQPTSDIPVPPCSPCNQECKGGDEHRAAALEANLPVKVDSTSF